MNGKCINEEQLMDYLYGRLFKEEIKKVERHLSECDRCLEELVTIKKIVSAAM